MPMADRSKIAFFFRSRHHWDERPSGRFSGRAIAFWPTSGYPGGLAVADAGVIASALAENGIAYLSVMGGTYESFSCPMWSKKSRRPGYMVALAQAIKKAVKVPVIAAGRISSPAGAEAILRDNKADLIGLARMLWVDPHWPQKARRGDDRKILNCNTKCDACFHG